MNFKCSFFNSNSDDDFSRECNCYCSDCISFNRCDFCIHTLECLGKCDDERCQFNDPAIIEILNQEKTIDFYRDEYDD